MARALELDYQRAPYTRRAPARPAAPQQPAGGADVEQLARRTALACERPAQATALATAPAVIARGPPKAQEPAGVRAAAGGVGMLCDAAAPKPSALYRGAGPWARGSASAGSPGPGLGPGDRNAAVAPLMRDTAAEVARCAGLLRGGPDARMPTRVQLEALGAPPEFARSLETCWRLFRAYA